MVGVGNIGFLTPTIVIDQMLSGTGGDIARASHVNQMIRGIALWGIELGHDFSTLGSKKLSALKNVLSVCRNVDVLKSTLRNLFWLYTITFDEGHYLVATFSFTHQHSSVGLRSVI